MTFISYSSDCSLHLMLNASLESSGTKVRGVKFFIVVVMGLPRVKSDSFLS